MNFIEWFTEKAISNNINRIYLYSELGGGKTTALKKLVKNLVDNYNDYRLIPIYIDCREIDYESKVISKQIISKYCWISKSEIKNDDNRVDILRECFFRNEYKYLIILDGTDLLKSDSMEKIYEELENLCYENSALFFIFANSNEKRFNDKVFKNCDFKKITLKLLDLYDSSIVENSTDIQKLDYHTRVMLSLPYFYSKYCNYKNDIDKVNEINLIDEYMKEILHIGIRSEESDEFSYRKTLLKEIIPPLVFDSKSGVIVLQNSAHNEMKTSDLSILKLVKSGDIESKYIISHEIIHSYFCEQYLYNVFEKSKDRFLNLINTKILDDLTLKLLGQRLEITNENRKNTELYKLIAIIRHMNKDKQINYSNALNNLLRVFCLTCTAQLAGFDLSELDLRLCCFIGVNCSGVSFENSICTDECFVPIEPENADIFSISENGRYFITGDKDVLNIRETQTNILIDRLLADEGNDFTYAESKGEYCFYIRQKNNILYVTIKNDFVNCTSAYDSYEEEQEQFLFDKLPENIVKHGTPCCVENGFVLVKTDVNSIYDSAYLLFVLQTEKLVSVCKYHIHISVSHIVQDGDEIEFLFENDGKPLKSICYNENNKAVYHKEYSSLVGKGIEFEGGTKLYFNTDNIDSFLKWYFDCEFLKYRNVNEWFDKDDNYNFFIGECYSYLENKSNIKTKNYQFGLRSKEYHLLFNNDKFLSYPQKIYCHNLELSLNDYRVGYYNDGIYFYNCINEKEISLKFNNSPKRFYAIGFTHINIFENKLIALGDSIVELNDKKHTFVTLYSYNLTFSNEYINEIKYFPWKDVVLKAIESYDDNMTTAEFENICKKIILREMLEDNCTWADVFAIYVRNFILFNEEVSSLEENISDSDFVEGIKHWCFPCDDGVIYYNGEYSCYLRINNSGESDEIPFKTGACLIPFRNGVHYDAIKDKYNVSYYYKMYDIYKNWSDNLKDSIRIPIYDLKLFNANMENISGLSGVVENIVERQITIDTYTVEYNV